MDLYDWVEKNVAPNVNIDILTPRELLLVVSRYLEQEKQGGA